MTELLAPNNQDKKKKATLFVAAAVLALAPLTARWEGFRTRPYKDPAGIWTVCNGETQVEMKVYTATECGAMLRKHLAQTYAPAIAQCLPGLVEKGQSYAFQAFLDAAYNAGPAATCRSPMAVLVRSGKLTNGCMAFAGWRVTAGGQRLRGLVARREWEKNRCLLDGKGV